METIIEVKKLNKVFKMTKTNEYHVLKDIDLKIKRGDFIAVMGKSGCGKSTLLYNVSGMDNITSGEIIFDGETISDITNNRLAQIRLNKMGFVFQHSHLLKDLNIFDNIILPGYSAKKLNRKKVCENANNIMQKLAITKLKDNKIIEASGGELQRVSIARALINKPEILFADEPTGALNTSATNDVIDILKEINNEGTTIMLVTHEARVAAVADTVLFMADGKILSQMNLGKCMQDCDIEQREQQLSNWLHKQGI